MLIFHPLLTAVFPQLSGVFTSLVVLIVLVLIGPLFYFLPKVCSLHASLCLAKNREGRKSSHFLSFSLSGSTGMHQCYQPKADVLTVPGLTGPVENQQDGLCKTIDWYSITGISST